MDTNVKQMKYTITKQILELAHQSIKEKHGEVKGGQEYTKLLEDEINNIIAELFTHSIKLWNRSLAHLPSQFLPFKSA